MNWILEMLYESGEMPEYYTFEQRDLVDTYTIAKEMEGRFTKDVEKEEWLKDLFDNTPIIREFYKN